MGCLMRGAPKTVDCSRLPRLQRGSGGCLNTRALICCLSSRHADGYFKRSGSCLSHAAAHGGPFTDRCAGETRREDLRLLFPSLLP